MYIENRTGKPIVVAMRASDNASIQGYDDREDLVEPGRQSNIWLHLEEDDVIVIEER